MFAISFKSIDKKQRIAKNYQYQHIDLLYQLIVVVDGGSPMLVCFG